MSLSRRPLAPAGLTCPFCAGHEAETPPPIATYGANGKGKWLVRVVPNKFPAVTSMTPTPAELPRRRRDATALPGFGRHEVIIESPRHVASLSELTDAEAEAAFAAYRDRLRQLKAERQYRYVQIFKNVGPAAGASLEHVHSQLVALPDVPEVVEQELDGQRRVLQATQALAVARHDRAESWPPASGSSPRRSTSSPSALMPVVLATRSGSRPDSISRDLKMWKLASLASFRGLCGR